MQSIDNVLKLRKGLKPDDPNPDIFDVLWAKKLSNVARDYTVTGNPLSFLAKKAQTAVSTKVSMEPIQDLHGYDNPWPAGGGKNLFDKDSPNIQANKRIAVSTGDIYNATGYSVSDYIPIELAERYALTIASNFTSYYAGYDANKQHITTPTNTWNSGTTKILSATGYAYVRFDFKTENIDTVQFEKGYASDYTPYSNICPISGRSSVEIKGCGKNQIETVADNVIYSSAGRNVIEFNNDVISFTPTYSTSTAFFLLKIFKVTSGMVGKTFTYSYQSSPQLSTYNSTFVLCDEDGGNRTAVRNKHQIIESEVGKIFTMRFFSNDNTKTYTISQIQVEEGESVSDYEPYTESNDVTITFPALGKNKFTKDGETSDSFLKDNGEEAYYAGWYLSDYIPISPNTTYTFNPNSTAGGSGKHGYFDESKNFISTISSGMQTFTSPSNAVFMRFSYRDSSTDIQLELGSTATSYEPYTNTVYSGTLDVETGVLTVDKTIVTIKNYDWVYDDTSGGFFKNSFSNKKRNDGYMISTALQYLNVTASNMPPYSMKQGASTYPTRIIIKMPSGVTTRKQLFELIGDEKIVFNLNTPTTIQLTPSQIQILKGQNNIWIEDGGVTIALTYKN